MNRWILKTKNSVEADHKLFCIPYAGGGATVFRDWQRHFGNKVSVCPIQLPGRESRMGEPLVNDIHRLADMIYEGIKDELDRDFSVFGHSMGGMVAYEVTKRIIERSGKKPQVLFMSATSLTRRKKDIPVSKLEDDALLDYIRDLGGLDEELLSNEKIRQMYMESYFPIIKNDYDLIERYTCEPYKLDCKVRAFAGRDDAEISNIETEEIEQFTNDFNIHFFDGGHFFINDSIDEVCKEIIKEAEL